MSWSIVTAEGSPMLREDIFATRTEAEAYLLVEPFTRSGKRQYALPTAAIARLQAQTRRTRALHELKLAAALRADTEREVSKLAREDAELDAAARELGIR